jgi:hypothetical protein
VSTLSAKPESAAESMPRAVTAPLPADLDSLTPAMRQYVEQKRQVGDAILLFRMGDFYELFYDDAKTGARLLGIALTSRDNGRTATWASWSPPAARSPSASRWKTPPRSKAS